MDKAIAYAGNKIRRQEAKFKRMVQFEDFHSLKKDKTQEIEERLVKEIEQRLILEKILNSNISNLELSQKQKNLLKELLRGKKVIDIAKEEGLSQPAISKIKNILLYKVRLLKFLFDFDEKNLLQNFGNSWNLRLYSQLKEILPDFKIPIKFQNTLWHASFDYFSLYREKNKAEDFCKAYLSFICALASSKDTQRFKEFYQEFKDIDLISWVILSNIRLLKDKAINEFAKENLLKLVNAKNKKIFYATLCYFNSCKQEEIKKFLSNFGEYQIEEYDLTMPIKAFYWKSCQGEYKRDKILFDINFLRFYLYFGAIENKRALPSNIKYCIEFLTKRIKKRTEDEIIKGLTENIRNI